MSAAQEGRDRSGSSSEIPNPRHRRVVEDLTLAHQRDGDLKYGDSTLLEMSADGGDILVEMFGFPGTEEFRRVMDLPPEHEDRQNLDRVLREKIESLGQIAIGGTAGQDKGAVARTTVGDDVTIVMNSGFGGSKPYHLILDGDQFYRVTPEGSEVGVLEQGNLSAVQMEFGEEVNQRYVNAIGSLSDLAKHQRLDGAALREALPELAEVFRDHYGSFVVGLQEIIGHVGRASHLSIDVPRDDPSVGSVKVRLYPSADYTLHSFEIVAI